MTDEQITPPDGLITLAERKVVRSAARTFVRSLVPNLPRAAALIGGPVAAVMLSAMQHWAGKAEIEKQATKSYAVSAEAVNDHAAEIKALQDGLAKLSETVEKQGHLLVANRPGFSSSGKPEKGTSAASAPRRRRPVGLVADADPILVQQVSAAATLSETVKRIVKALPAPKTIPPTLEASSPAPIPKLPIVDASAEKS